MVSATFGTIDIRRRLTNTSGVAINRLRFRIIDLTTFPAPAGTADLRARSSGSVQAEGRYASPPGLCFF